VFGVAQPEEILRSLAEAVLREVLAEESFLALLTDRREAFQHEVARRLRQRVAETHPLGISLQSITLQDLHPPQEVVEAYYAVTRALSQKDRLVGEARRERETTISLEEVARHRLLAVAQGEFHAATARTEAERDAFLSLAGTQRAAWLHGLVLPIPGAAEPLSTLVMLWNVERAGDRLALPRQLTEFRLQMEAAEQVLAGRAKVLHDPQTQGQLQVVPELLKLRMPFLRSDPDTRTPRNEGP
jgi:hypothetical protein